MEGQPQRETTQEEFNAKVEEVFGKLGEGIAAMVSPDAEAAYFDFVRGKWQSLGRSFAELMDMEPPR